MAVSKRLRFEILRRDNHACRYCGGVAPDVELTVDHVIPVALGGTDEPANLVAACRDCNSGKSSVPADAAIVDDVAQDALRWAKAMETAFARRAQEAEAENGYLADFYDRWSDYTFVGTKNKIDLPSDWERTVRHWYGIGVPIALLLRAIDTAMGKKGLRGYDAEFRYMAGTVWSSIREAQAEAKASLEPVTEPLGCPHCDDPDWCSANDGGPCHVCEKPNCAWACGYESGSHNGWNELYRKYSYEIAQSRVLSAVCDFGGWTEPEF